MDHRNSDTLVVCPDKVLDFGLGRLLLLVVAVVINTIIFFHELLAFVIDVADHKQHGNSALLVLLNIPIAALYFLIFSNL